MSSRVDKIKRRLKRRHAWQHNYLDELVENTMRANANKLSNEGPRAQTNFLLQNGWSVDEIIEHGKKVRHLIRKHIKGVVGHHHKRRHK